MRTIDDLANALGVHRSTVSRAIAGGAIRSIPVGRIRRIPNEEFVRVLSAGISPDRRERDR